jgi:hypothetical protein
VTGVTSGSLGAALKAGLIAGVTALANFQVGTFTQGLDTPIEGLGKINPLNIAAHALVGCASSVASGGSCKSGALAAGVSAAAAPLIDARFPNPLQNPGNLAAGTAISATVGGLASVAGGGKFANGAVTAAFGYLLNDASHSKRALLAFGFPDDQDYPQFVHWKLSSASDVGGIIIQEVDTKSSELAGNSHYFEAWHVAPGNIITNEFMSTPGQEDDHFTAKNLPAGGWFTPGGWIKWNATATFYEGMTDDDLRKMGFSYHNVPAAGALMAVPATSINIPGNFLPSIPASRIFCLGRC